MKIAEFNKEKGYMVIEGEGEEAGKVKVTLSDLERIQKFFGIEIRGKKMNKIAEQDYASEYSMSHMWGKLNIVIQALNNLKCVEEEEPIYEVLDKYECLIISKNEEGLLVACNTGGIVELKRVKYPKEEEEE